MITKTLLFAPMVALVAPAMAQEEQAPAQQLTVLQIMQAGAAIIDGGVKVLSAVDSKESADVAAAGLDQLTAMAKKVEEAVKANEPKMVETEQEECAKIMASVPGLTKNFVASANALGEKGLLTEKLINSIGAFAKAMDIDMDGGDDAEEAEEADDAEESGDE